MACVIHRPTVLYNKRALQIAEALDATCDHLDRKTSFDRTAVDLQPAKPSPTWVVDKDFQGSEAVRLQRNRQVVLRTLALNSDCKKNASGEVMAHIDPAFRQNRNFVYSAVQLNGLALRHAPEEFRDDRDIVLAAVIQNGLALEYASRNLKDDCEVCSFAVAQKRKAMEHVGPQQRDSYEVQMAADHSGKLRDDRAWMLRALQEEPHLLMYASRRMIMDPEVVMTACREDGLCLAYASKSLKAETRIVRVAVEQNGLALQYAGASQQNNITIVNYATRQNGLALEFASEALKADKRVVLRALQYDGLALEFATPHLQMDKGVVIRALKQNVQAWRFAHPSLRKDPEFSSKRLQKLLALDFEIELATEEEVQEEQEQAMRQSFMKSDRSNLGTPASTAAGRLPVLAGGTWFSESFDGWPDHPSNGALVPTWQMSAMTSTAGATTTSMSTPGKSKLDWKLDPTLLPTVPRSNSSPALTTSPARF